MAVPHNLIIALEVLDAVVLDFGGHVLVDGDLEDAEESVLVANHELLLLEFGVPEDAVQHLAGRLELLEVLLVRLRLVSNVWVYVFV